MATAMIGFIGLGRMGTPVAKRLIAAGYGLTVDETVAASVDAFMASGAKAAASPNVVANAAEVVFASPPAPDAVRAVATGAGRVIHGARARIFVDLSTADPRTSAEVGAAFADSGRTTIVDCPVSAGVGGAAKGALTLMVSGPTGACDEVEPLLKHFGKIFRCGDKLGQAQAVKLAKNVVSVAAMAVCCEALVLGAREPLVDVHHDSCRLAHFFEEIPNERAQT